MGNMNKQKKTLWQNIPIEERKHSKWDGMRNFFINLDDKQFLFWRGQLLGDGYYGGFEDWQRLMRQLFGFRLPPRVQELMSSVYFAKN